MGVMGRKIAQNLPKGEVILPLDFQITIIFRIFGGLMRRSEQWVDVRLG